MTVDKTSQVRDHILSLLERGDLAAGNKIPGARGVASELGISFLKVQQALETLARDGILEMRGRRGTFVQPGWQERILHENVSVFNKRDLLPWLNGLMEIMEQWIPGLRFTHAFKKGMMELKTTLYVQENHDQYMDVSGLLDECFPDRSTFFEEVFAPFRIGGKLIGIPTVFSPRVIYYHPDLFERAGCAQPEPDWTWDCFMETVRKLKGVLPTNRILNVLPQAYYWLNFVMRSGGSIFDAHGPAIGSAQVRTGLKRFSQLWDELDRFQLDGDAYNMAFYAGEAAMFMGGRQSMNLLQLNCCKGWKTAPLPSMPGGRDVTSQATDLICIRKSCTNMSLAREYIRMMLSETVQDYIGQQKYGIPIRKSSAFKSIDLTDPNDSIFAVEMGKMGSETVGESTSLARLMLTGIDRVLVDRMDIDSGIDELEQTAKVFLGIQEHSRKRATSEELLSIA